MRSSFQIRGISQKSKKKIGDRNAEFLDAITEASFYDNFKAFFLKEKRPVRRGKVTRRRYQGENNLNDYIPAPHACFLGSYFEIQNNEDGEGNDYVIYLWMSGGYLTGDENMLVEDSKEIKESIINIKRATIEVWSVRRWGKLFFQSV